MPLYKAIIPNDFILRYDNATSSPSPNSLFILKALGEAQQMSKYCLCCLACKMCICIYRIVLKYWDTQRIGTSLKIVKIIILADPKNWTILRKRKYIRNFSDPKNWDGVFGAPK